MLHTKQFDKKHLGHLTVPQNPTFDRFLPDLAHKKLYSVRGVDFLGKVSGAISIFVCQFLQKRAVSRFLFQIRTKPRWNICFCCASALLCSFFFSSFFVWNIDLFSACQLRSVNYDLKITNYSWHEKSEARESVIKCQTTRTWTWRSTRNSSSTLALTWPPISEEIHHNDTLRDIINILRWK